MDCATLIRIHRTRSGFSQRELAKRAATSAAAICLYETGQRVPRVDTLARILRATGATLVVDAWTDAELDASVMATFCCKCWICPNIFRRVDRVNLMPPSSRNSPGERRANIACRQDRRAPSISQRSGLGARVRRRNRAGVLHTGAPSYARYRHQHLRVA